MKKTTIAAVLLLAFTVQSLVQACKKDDEPDQEFIADNTTFSGFWNFTLHTTKQGPDPILGSAHFGNDADAMRQIYFKDDVSRSGSEYPAGAVIVKHVTKPGGALNEVFAMVKRGGGYDPSGQDWEYFRLFPDGAIKTDGMGNELRGFNLEGGSCKGCHAVAEDKDYTFTK